MTTIAPPPLSPGGRTAFRVFLVVVATVAVVGTVIALGATAWGVSTFRVVADEKTLPAGTRTLTIDTGDVPAAVRLRTDRDAVEPRITMRLLDTTRSDEQALDVRTSGSDTRVVVTGGRADVLGWGRAGEITVSLPPETSRRLAVTTRQGTGVLFAGADLDSLTATNADGAVVLGGSARRLEVRTQDADVVTREPVAVAESFVADTVNGDVTVDFADAAPATIEAATETGDVALGLPDPGPYLVRASGASTRVRVSETEDAGRAAARVTVRAGDGSAAVDRSGAPRLARHDRP